MSRSKPVLAIAATLFLLARAQAASVPLQPLAQQAREIENALAYLGEPLSTEESSRLDDAMNVSGESKAVERLENVLDSHVLAVVEINPESLVRVEPGPAMPELVESGTRIFLVKVLNAARSGL